MLMSVNKFKVMKYGEIRRLAHIKTRNIHSVGRLFGDFTTKWYTIRQMYVQSLLNGIRFVSVFLFC